jgi:branched-chain amino acid transport system substrate-binding protein
MRESVMKKILSLILVCFLISACSGGESVTQRWKDRDPAGEAPRTLAIPHEKQIDPEAEEVGTDYSGGLGPYADRDMATIAGQMPNIPEASYVPPVKVAILLPLSGESSALGQSMLQAAQLALFDLGASTFELLPRDTKGTEEGARVAAEQAVANGAQLILGPLFSTSVSAVKPIAARANINVIAFSTDWTLAGGNTYLMGFMPFGQVDTIARNISGRGIGQIALITTTDTYGTAVERSLRDAARYNGFKISHVLRLPPQAIYGFGPQDVPAIQASGAQAVLIAIGGHEAIHVSQVLDGAGLKAAVFPRFGTGLWDDPALAIEPTMQGARFAAPSPDMRNRFEENYSNVYGTAPIRLASLAYDATALAAVLGKNGEFDRASSQYHPAYTRTDLLSPNGFAGIDGIFRFSGNNLVQRGLSVLEFRKNRIIEVDPAPRRF